jgi:hypothetical protein
MRRRLAFGSSILAIVLVLVLPATTLAATFTYIVQEDTCSASGGDYGYGHLYFKVKLTETGNSHANKFTFTAKAQHKNLGGTRWYTDMNFGKFTYNFPSNGATNWYSRWYSYDPGDFAWHRITVTLKVWHNSTLLAKRTVHGSRC